MKKVYGLEDWLLDAKVKNDKRFANVKIVLQYPYTDQKVLIDLKPRERVKRIGEGFKGALKKLIALDLFDNYELTGSKKRTSELKVKVRYSVLSKLDKLDLVASVWIESVENATKINTVHKLQDKFFCVKMTVISEIEGLVSKKQTIEKRLVLIKAKSFDDAYDKLNKKKDTYVEPYLNADGRFVRWRIDSFDDCFETDTSSAKDLDNPEGVEVYSKLKSRKNKAGTPWDGKF
jgi:hypothetical protein